MRAASGRFPGAGAIASLVLEVVDHSYPVDVGKNVTYTISITSSGTAPVTDVRLLRAVSGPSAVTTGEAGSVRVASLESLGVGEESVWRVRMRGLMAGSSRLRVMVSEGSGLHGVSGAEITVLQERPRRAKR